MKNFKYDWKSPTRCLTYPNAASNLHIDENYCRAHIRPGQDIVDSWGANMRREHSLLAAAELLDQTAYLDDEMVKYYAGRKTDPERRDYASGKNADRNRLAVELVKSGLTAKEAAERFGITPNYMRLIVRKLNGGGA